ncbi:MAG: trigger factor [Pseudomonadota bacterium]
MQVSVEASNGLERTLRVELPAEQVDAEIEQRLRKVGKTAKLPGFRPGKIPLKVIRQRFGPQVRQEVLGDLLQSSYSAAIREQQLMPAGSPHIETENSDTGLAYKATFEIMPTVELQDIESIAVTRPNVSITEADIDAMLASLQEQKATWEVVDRAAGEGDQVIVDFDGAIDDEPIANGKGENVPVVLGSGQMLDDFDSALRNASADAELAFDVTYPADYPQEDLAGKTAHFTAAVKEVREKQLPPIDDDLAKEFGIEDGGIEKLRTDVEENMRNEVAQKVRADVKDQALKGLLDNNPFDVPRTLVHRDAQAMQHEAMRRMGVESQDQAPPVENFTEAAERRVRLTLLLQELVSKEQLVVSEDALRERVTEMFAGYDEQSRIVDNYLGNQEMRTQVEHIVLEDLAVERLIEKGSEESKDVAFSDYMNP